VKIISALFGGICLFLAVMLWVESQSAIHEILAGIILLVAVVSLGISSILGRLDKLVEQTQRPIEQRDSASLLNESPADKPSMWIWFVITVLVLVAAVIFYARHHG
jgi:hypothetical protein